MANFLIESGKLRHKLDLQETTDSRDAAGGVTKSWASVKYIYCQISPVTAREIIAGDQITQDITHVIRMRSQLDVSITPSMRLVKSGTPSRIFNIKAVIDAQESNIMTEITAIEDLNASS